MPTVPEHEHRPRSYHSELRRTQAEQTRALVLDAARVLFEERGYEGTSVAAIAEAARVSAETVYARFGSKRVLLGELVRLSGPRRRQAAAARTGGAAGGGRRRGPA